MRVLVTGSQGFIGKNLTIRLQESPEFEIIRFDRTESIDQLTSLIENCDFFIHLAGENRPKNIEDYETGNSDLAAEICHALCKAGKNIPVILASTCHAETAAIDATSDLIRAYGKSKRTVERHFEEFAAETGSSVAVFRLPGVFGKWCRPNYNSVVATFCHNIANGLPIKVAHPEKSLQLVYVDDVVDSFLSVMTSMPEGVSWPKVSPEYTIALADLATKIAAFKESYQTLVLEPVGTGFTRALYATFMSYLPKQEFVCDTKAHTDARGTFVEMLKTPNFGQVSVMKALPGAVRGNHYHHSKTEKFLVVAGQAQFRFRDILSGDILQVDVDGDTPQIVETVPGWTHSIENTGATDLIVILWANEIYDQDRPDTVPCEV